VIRVRDVERVARIFDQGVLETATGAEEWNLIFAGETDGGERAFHFSIGTAGHAPNPLRLFGGNGLSGSDFVSAEPFRSNLKGEFFGSERERLWDGFMRENLFPAIAD